MFNFRCVVVSLPALMLAACAAQPQKPAAHVDNPTVIALYTRLDADEKKYFAAREPAVFNADPTTATIAYKQAWDDAQDAQALCVKTRGCDTARFDAAFTRMSGGATTPANEADVTIALAANDVRDSTTNGDYLPNPSGADVTLVPKLRISDTYNGSSLDDPATVVDLDFGVPVACAATASGAVGSDCNLTTSANAVTPGSILEGHNMVLQAFRTRLNDSGANNSPGDSDDRAFAQQGIYIP